MGGFSLLTRVVSTSNSGGHLSSCPAIARGVSKIPPTECQNLHQLLLTDGQTQASVTCFTTGNALVQGAASPLKTQLQTWWDQQKTSSSPLKLEATPEKTPEGTMAPPFKAHIGTDEAGKGDYFGPLVVAGVFVDEQKAPQLRALGVRDSW